LAVSLSVMLAVAAGVAMFEAVRQRLE